MARIDLEGFKDAVAREIRIHKGEIQNALKRDDYSYAAGLLGQLDTWSYLWDQLTSEDEPPSWLVLDD